MGERVLDPPRCIPLVVTASQGGVVRCEDAVRHVVGLLGGDISCDYDPTEKRGSEFIARGLISMLKVR